LVFRVNPQFAGEAYRAGYHDLPRDEERVEVQPGSEEKIVAELRAKIASAEAAIEQHAEFLRLPAETRELNIAGHRVTIEFSPSEHFLWKVRVFIPTSLKHELNSPTLLGTIWDAWQDEEDGRLSLFDITKDKEEYFRRVQKEMAKVAAELKELQEWRTQPPQHYDLPGNVHVTISPHPEWAFYYKAQVVAPKPLIEVSKACGLKLTRNTWSPFGDQNMELTWRLRDREDVEIFLDNIRSEVEEGLGTEIIAQYSVN
jgi:hypothetical protein